MSMRKSTLLGGFLILVLALAACAPAPTATDVPTDFPTVASTLSVPVTGNTETTDASMTGTVSETATSELLVISPTVDAGTNGAVMINTSTAATTSEPFLVDQQGRALYLFTMDAQNSGVTTCTDTCAAEWPRVLVSGTPQAGEGVNASLLGTITLEDGTMQATYNGWPLYYFAGDLAPGDISGQGMNSSWYLVSGSGNAIQQ